MLLKAFQSSFLLIRKIYRFFSEDIDDNNTSDESKNMNIKLMNVKMCVNNGVMIADVLCDGVLEARKTFFPSSWNREKVIEKLAEAAKNTIDVAVTIEGVQAVFTGATSEGAIIKFVIDVKSGNYITAYPDARANGLFS